MGAAASGKLKRSKQSFGISPLMAGLLGAVLGLLIAVPPYSSDSNWSSAIKSGDLGKIEKALVPSYLNPQNSQRYAFVYQLLEANKFYDLSYKYAKEGVTFNPGYFEAWRMLYYSQKSSIEEKSLAKENLVKLDPLNPNIFDSPQQ